MTVSGGYPFMFRKTQESGPRNSESVFAGQMPGAVDACERMCQHEVELHQTIVICADKMYGIHCDGRNVTFFELFFLIDDHHNITDNELAKGEATDRERRVCVTSRANRALGADVAQAVVLTDRGVAQLDCSFDISIGTTIEIAMTLCYGLYPNQVRPEERIAYLSDATKAIAGSNLRAIAE